MSKFDPTELTKQIKENTSDLTSFVSDLNQWTQDIKKQDDLFKNQTNKEEENLPPVRHSTSKKSKKESESKQIDDKNKKPQRISGFDYTSWDKFDVDKAVEDLDKQLESSSEEEDVVEIEKLRQKAFVEKDKGNEFFKSGKYDEAISCYTTGLQCDPTNPLILSNRAMAFIKKQQFGAAIQDCSESLEIDPTYTKSYQRRATAYIGLQKYEEAKNDLLKVLELEPNNKQSKAELDKLLQHVNNQKAKPSTSKTESKPVVKIAEKHSTRKKSPVTIKEEKKEAMSSSSAVDDTLVMWENFKDKTRESKLIIDPVSKPPHKRSKKPLRNLDIPDFDPDAKPVAKSTPVASEEEITTIPVKLPPLIPPKTYFQFHTTWRSLKNFPEKKFEYLKIIQPTTLPKIFDSSMDSSQFSEILNILIGWFVPNNVEIYPVLLNLSYLKRFTSLSLFFSDEDNTALEALFDAANFSSVPKEEISILKKKYLK